MTMSKSTTSKTLSIFWKYTAKYKGLFYVGTFGAVFAVLAQDIIPPFIVSRAFARLQTGYATHNQLSFSTLVPYIVAFSVSMLIGVIIWRIQGYVVWRFEIKTSRDQIVDIFHHLELQGHRFHSNRFGGALVSQANKFTSAYERLMDEFIWSVIPSVTALIASIAVLLFVAYKFAIILTVVVIIYIIIMNWRVRHQFPFNREEAERESERTAALADAITNISNIRSFAREDYELNRFAKSANRTLDAYSRLSIETFKNDSISHTMTNGFRIISFLFGIYAVTSLVPTPVFYT